MNTHTSKAVLGLGLIIAFALPLAAQTTILVPGDFSTIQAGLNAASPGDTVLVAPGTYTGPNNRNLNFYGKAVKLKSEQGPGVTIIDAQHLDRCFVFNSDEALDTVVEGFTIRAGAATVAAGTYDGGCITAGPGAPTIRNCVITGCTAERNGGGLASGNGTFIDSCTFTSNGAGWKGGGVYGNAVVWNTDFSNNEANDTYSNTADGGGVYLMNGSSEVRGCRFAGNNACRGGALYIEAGSVRNNLFHGNTAYTECSSLNLGGAVYSDHAGQWIEFATFIGNDALDGGSSVYSNYGTTNLWHSILWDSPTIGLASSASGDFSVTYSDVSYNAGVYPGTGNLNADPLFVTGPGTSPANSVYLSQTAAGQGANSPCINAGQYTPVFFSGLGFGDGVRMDSTTTRTDQALDAGMVDLGYHQYFGPLFADGFEGGTTDGWDDVAP